MKKIKCDNLIHCIDCNKILNTRNKHVLRCFDCHSLLRNLVPSYNGNFKNKLFECDTCGEKLSHRGENTKNCYDCHIELIKKPIGICIDCDKILSKSKYDRCVECSNKYKGRNKKRCIDCFILISSVSLRCYKCNGLYCRGSNHPLFGKQTHGNYGYYKDIWMRSSWELNFAKWCDLSGIEWLYESETFDLGYTTYTPDFYLPEFDLWIEVKGYWRDDAKKKFKKFKRLYKNINIEIFDKNKMQLFSII